MELDEALRVFSSLAETGVEYVLVGGAALNLHGIIRATEDLDIFVRPSAENIARLRSALSKLYDDPCIEEICAEDLAGDYPAVRYGPPAGDLYLDILARLGDFASIDDLEYEEIDVRGVVVRVATPSTLYWMKRATVRALDRADADALQLRFELKEREE